MQTADKVKRAWPIGCHVETRAAGYLRKGQSVRGGTVVGYCDSFSTGDYVRVSWDGWKSSIAIRTSNLQQAPNPRAQRAAARQAAAPAAAPASLTVLIVDQFDVSPYELRKHPMTFDDLVAELTDPRHDAKVSFRPPVVKVVDADFRPSWGTTVIRADERGMATIWKTNWDSSG